LRSKAIRSIFFSTGPKDPRGNTELAAQLPRAEEGSMYKSLIAIAGALAVVSAGSLMADRAEAGASASAPTKYSQAKLTGSQMWSIWRARRATGTSEYSASNPRRR
jgi:hypothetical protein